jgi:hypothetical protein
MDANEQNVTGIPPATSATHALRLTRSGARRRGDEYQDVQALSILVEWLEQADRYQWVQLEADESGFLDDILALRSDGVLDVWQVKFSTISHAPDDMWGWDALLEQKPGVRGPRSSLLQKWFVTWQDYLSRGIKVSPGLLTNRRAAPELALSAPRGGNIQWGDLLEETRRKILAQLGDEAQVRAFFEAFQFRVGEPSLRGLEEGTRQRFERLGGTLSGLYALEKAVREWVNTKDNPPPDGYIHLDEVRRVSKLKAYPVRLRTFLPPVMFFERYMEPPLLFHHRLPQVGRRAQLNGLLTFVEGDAQIGLLPGRGGSGKSKLLHTLCRRLARRRPDLSVRLVAENLPIKETALEELPDDSCLVIVDDAHRTAGIEVLLAAAHQYPNLKVLLVTRPHATDYLAAQARSAGFDRNHIVINEPLPDLNYAREHRRLARLVLGRDWAHYADRLAAVTRDSPLLTVLGGELLRTEQVAPSFLDRHDTFRQEVLSRFRDVQFGHIISQLDPRFTPQLCAEVLPLVAALTPFDTENTALLQAVARLSGTDEVKLKQLLGALVKGGALVRGGRLVRIVPDVLSDFILHEACFTPDGVPTGWATRVYQEVADFRLDVVLRNLAELDWRVRTAPLAQDESSADTAIPETGLLDFVWRDIEERFRAGSLAERKDWLARFERIASMQPHRLWPLVEIALNEPASEDQEEVSLELRPWHRPTTQADVLAALAPILRGVARDERYTARCAELLWEMGRDQETRQGYSSSVIETLRQLASYEKGKPLVFSHIVLERCREWMNDPDIHKYRHSVLEVLSPMLERRVNWMEMDGRWLSHGSFILPPEPLRELRHGALELVERCALSGERRVVLEALHTLHAPVSEEGLWGLRDEDPTEWQAWEEETIAALEIVARVAERNDDPFVRLRIWEELHLQAEHGPRPAVRSRAREILEAIPHSFESRFILLLTGSHGWERYRRTWAHPEEDDDEWVKADQATRYIIDQKRFQRDAEFASQVTREWVELHPNPREGFDALDEWIIRIEASGWWKDFWTRSNPFMLQLAVDYPSYARALCEIAIEKPEAHATGKCDDLLCELRRQDQKEALKLVQRFLEQDHPNLWQRVAGSYAWRCWPTDPLPEEWQIVHDLLAFPYPQVKRSAARIVSAIASTDMGRALEMILETEIGEDSELANTLFAIFEERRGFNFGEIKSDVLGRLLEKISRLESVRSYHLGRFLLRAALRDPVAVARFLLGRVMHKIQLDKHRIEKPVADFRQQILQTLDKFGGLPQSGFHDEGFKEVAGHPDYHAALRVIRDAALDEEYRWALTHEDTLPELFRDFSLNYCPASLEILNEWIDSGDCVKVRTAVYLLGDTYLGFYVRNLLFVSNYLRRAKECGELVFEEVERAMLHNAEYGPPRAMASHRGERSNALFHKAMQALEQAQGDQLTVRFFQQIRDKGQEMIQSEMRQAAEEEVFFRS